MVADYDEIFGFRFEPLTAASYSRLLVLESPFLWRRPASSGAVRDYLWNHFPGFNVGGHGRAPFLAAFERRLVPRWMRLFYSRAARRSGIDAGYAQVAEKIADLMAVAFSDAPAPATGPARRICATLEAQMIELFAARYHWAPERTRATPLRQLYQFIRCNDTNDYDAEEAAIIAEDLKRDNETAHPVPA